MLTININLAGAAEHVCNELTEKPTDTPETEIRKALANYFAENCEPEDHVTVTMSAAISI